MVGGYVVTMLDNVVKYACLYDSLTIILVNPFVWSVGRNYNKRDMLIKYNDKMYSIEYLNNIDEADIELEIQALEVTK